MHGIFFQCELLYVYMHSYYIMKFSEFDLRDVDVGINKTTEREREREER